MWDNSGEAWGTPDGAKTNSSQKNDKKDEPTGKPGEAPGEGQEKSGGTGAGEEKTALP